MAAKLLVVLFICGVDTVNIYLYQQTKFCMSSGKYNVSADEKMNFYFGIFAIYISSAWSYHCLLFAKFICMPNRIEKVQ